MTKARSTPKATNPRAGDGEYENVIDYAALELAETVARTLTFRKIEEHLTAKGEPANNL